MKKLIMLFLLVSFMCFGEEKIEPKKSYEVVQREEIDFLKIQLIKSNNKIDDLSKKVEELEEKEKNNFASTYSVDQIYQNSVQYYDKSLEFLKWIIGGMLLVLGYLKWDGNKKYEKERKEVTRELDKRLERMWEENTELKEKIAEQEKEVERKTLELDEKIEETGKEMGEKIKIVEFNAKLAIASNKNTPKEKVEELKKLVKKYPNETEGYFSLADSLLRLNKIEEALVNYDKIIKLDSKHIGAHLNRGAVKSELGENEEAIEDYDVIIKLNPEYKVAYLNRGNSRFKLMQYAEAIKDYNMAIKLEPKDCDSYHCRGFTYNSLAVLKMEVNNYKDAKKYYKKAIKDYDKAIEINFNNASLYNNRGFTYSSLAVLETKESNYKEAIKNYEEAIKNYKKTIKLDSNSIVSKENLERVQKELKKLEEKE